ncbi:MAG: ribonuclease E/G [Rhodospirillaceae bacterium]|jgi:ribonuclease E|nr:ribonuclease E/G [Rhodospirillaceae bacterium]
MVKRILIDAVHEKEVRVAVMNDTCLEEFDIETSARKQLRGNIYLAKIIRVEPALQAAFVEYGGNRHGFLSFSEIHPDYYQIPIADRKALLSEHNEAIKQSITDSSVDFDGDSDDEQFGNDDQEGFLSNKETLLSQSVISENNSNYTSKFEDVDSISNKDIEKKNLKYYYNKHEYKIQEVIKQRQIVLVQIVKEERGNKGVTLTTNVSLAGRYCILMPNTANGGGVSRKITNIQDRKRLREIISDMNIFDGMTVIIRTAGAERTKSEIKKDYEYLIRLWESIRELTLKSIAPTLIYEEANLIKRSIRDLYVRDIDEVQVAGEKGYHLAKNFMRMLVPSHVRRVKLFKDSIVSLFQYYKVEEQLDLMHSPIAQLKSGGYLVINQTEALVAIDVNSGRSIKWRNIEETALKTNCEAADEVARQLRLRDLAGLIVIDFIDMNENCNNYTVERRLKDAVRSDRAKIQIGKTSEFGLIELSRQRLRPSLIETNFLPCSYCGGVGLVRSVESTSMYILHLIEEEGIRRYSSEITLTVHNSVALYILNQKRKNLTDIEERYNFRVFLVGDDLLVPPAYRIEKVHFKIPAEIQQPTIVEQLIAEEVENAKEEIIDIQSENKDFPIIDGAINNEAIDSSNSNRYSTKDLNINNSNDSSILLPDNISDKNVTPSELSETIKVKSQPKRRRNRKKIISVITDNPIEIMPVIEVEVSAKSKAFTEKKRTTALHKKIIIDPTIINSKNLQIQKVSTDVKLLPSEQKISSDININKYQQRKGWWNSIVD